MAKSNGIINRMFIADSVVSDIDIDNVMKLVWMHWALEWPILIIIQPRKGGSKKLFTFGSTHYKTLINLSHKTPSKNPGRIFRRHETPY